MCLAALWRSLSTYLQLTDTTPSHGAQNTHTRTQGLSAFPFGHVRCQLELGAWTYGPWYVNVSPLGKVRGRVRGGSSAALQVLLEDFGGSGSGSFTSRALHLSPILSPFCPLPILPLSPFCILLTCALIRAMT